MNHQALYKKYNTPKRSIKHMKQVAHFSELIADMDTGMGDVELLSNLALFAAVAVISLIIALA